MRAPAALGKHVRVFGESPPLGVVLPRVKTGGVLGVGGDMLEEAMDLGGVDRGEVRDLGNEPVELDALVHNVEVAHLELLLARLGISELRRERRQGLFFFSSSDATLS